MNELIKTGSEYYIDRENNIDRQITYQLLCTFKDQAYVQTVHVALCQTLMKMILTT